MKVDTYVINLDGSNDRLENAKTVLSNQNVIFERFPAVDGRGKPLSEFPTYDDAKAQDVMGRSLLNGEIGCFLSHVGCVDRFLKSDADYLVVLEDDMQIDENFKSTVDGILNFLNQQQNLDWYLINIGPKKRKYAKTLTQVNQHDLTKAFYFPIRTIGLVWSRQGAQAFQESTQQIYMPVDNFLQQWLCKSGKGLSVWPAIVSPSGYDSEIDVNRSNKKEADLGRSFKRKKLLMSNKYHAIKNYISG